MVNAFNPLIQGILNQITAQNTNTNTSNNQTDNQSNNALPAINEDNIAAQDAGDRIDISAQALEQINNRENIAPDGVINTFTGEFIEQPLINRYAAAPDPRAAIYEPFYQGRPGFSTTNLSNAVADPSQQPFSQNRPFPQVAEAARESLDNRYQALRDTGEPYGTQINGVGQDRFTLFGELDRRALYAVASNEGNLFTQDEQTTARDLLRQQQGNAAGFPNGGSREARENFISPYLLNDKVTAFKAGIDFLDNVSLEEQTTDFEFAEQRANAIGLYEHYAEKQGVIPEDVSSDNPLVQVIANALEQFGQRINETAQSAQFGQFGQNGLNLGNVNFRSFLENNFQDRIASAQRENQSILAAANR